MRSTTKLRMLLDGDGLISAPGVFEGISAKLAEDAGFSLGYVTGGGSAVSRGGLPDLGLMTMTEMAEHAGRLAFNLDIPLIADADTGYGNALNVTRTVREYERAGLAGLHLEDQVFPKRCGHLPNKELIPAAEFETKIRAACAARKDDDFVIIARTDARAPAGLDEAIERANRFAAAGADVVWVEAPESTEEVEEIAERVDAPLMVNMIASSATPPVSREKLEELGYRIAIYPAVSLAAAYHAIKDALTHLYKTGSDDMGATNIEPRELFELVGLTEWTDLESRFATDV